VGSVNLRAAQIRPVSRLTNENCFENNPSLKNNCLWQLVGDANARVRQVVISSIGFEAGFRHNFSLVSSIMQAVSIK
jgi:hypothetical protein